MNNVVWRPSQERVEQSNIQQFITYINKTYGKKLSKYDDLHQWSVQAPEKFWVSVWNYCEVVGDMGKPPYLENAGDFINAQWFPNAYLNYAENLLKRRNDITAIVAYKETGEQTAISFMELNERVKRMAAGLQKSGVTISDCVVGFMPNTSDTLVAMLATASLGAVWSSCSPDFGINGAVERFSQVQPKVLISTDGYYYNGKQLDSLNKIQALCDQITSIEQTVIVPYISTTPDISALSNVSLLDVYAPKTDIPLTFIRVPFDHPLFIMFSSGTTGKPKCIVHSVGGTLIQHQKEHVLHTDLTAVDVLFYYTTCGWMMWNWLASALATGSTLVLFDGSPFYPGPERLFDLIDAEGITVFGTSAKYLSAVEKAELTPKKSHKLSKLKSILSTGSPLAPESYDYVYASVKEDVCLSSISGGTDIISCFILGCPIEPVFRGELQVAGLGMDVTVLDDEGNSTKEQKGELVCRNPFPSKPIGFLNDDNKQRFSEAYFSRYENIWSQSDYAEHTTNDGFIIYGRSDAVLNPGGVRIGTAEIYRQVEKNSNVLESLAIAQDWNDDCRVVLFVRLKNGINLSDEFEQQLRRDIRTNATPKHVPEKIIQVPDIPKTISGKIVELAVRDVVHGRTVKNVDALANPQALDYFKNLTALAV